MDLVTQGITGGGSCSGGSTGTPGGRQAALVGLCAGLLPDADALISSSTDPLLQLSNIIVILRMR